MTKVQSISVALFAITMTAAPVVAWAVMMYHELQATGVIIAASL